MGVPTGALSFKTLQDLALENGFTESNRADMKNFINFRYGWLVGLEEWTFRRSLAAVTFTAGQNTLGNLPSSFGTGSGVAVTLQTSDGTQLGSMDWGDFNERYFGTQVSSGTPQAFTVVSGFSGGAFGTQIYIGPTPQANDTGQLQYLLGLCHLDNTGAVQPGPMVSDTDYPILPPEHHVALVLGAKASGFRLTNVPMAQQLEQDFSNSLAAMRANYLEDIRADTGSMPLDQITFG